MTPPTFAINYKYEFNFGNNMNHSYTFKNKTQIISQEFSNLALRQQHINFDVQKVIC